MNEISQRLTCEFQLLRYVPDPVRDEGVQIGVILREQGSGHAEVRFTRDWRRVRCLDPDAATAVLEAMEVELQRLASGPTGELMRILEESFSLNVQLSKPKAYLAQSLSVGMDQLMKLHVEAPPKAYASPLNERAAIHARMRSEFEHAGVWALMRKRISASEYTRSGDPLIIDVGYVADGLMRMFHAVSLNSDPESRGSMGLEMAKVLAFSATEIKRGVERIEKARLELTAFVEPATQLGATEENREGLMAYRFCVETMEMHDVRVLKTSNIGSVAETARRELLSGFRR